MKLIVVDGFSFSFSDPSVVATVVLTGTPSVKSKVDGKGVCKHGFSATISAITVPSAGATIPDPGTYTVNFQASSVNNTDDAVKVLLEGDTTNDITATPQIPGGPTPYPVTFHLTISAAGQLSTKGD